MFSLFKNYIKDNGSGNIFNAKTIRNNKIKLKIHGNNNQIILADDLQVGKSKISIYGDNNLIHIGNNKNKKAKSHLIIGISGFNNNLNMADNIDFGTKMEINMGLNKYQDTHKSRIHIGENTSFGSIEILLLENNSEITIGADCLFSNNIRMRLSDTHAIMDMEGNLSNQGQSIEIGKHVWVGMDVKIGKNTKIADNSIVGWESVVTKHFEQTNIVIAGNPAKIVKENIQWSTESPQAVLDRMQK